MDELVFEIFYNVIVNTKIMMSSVAVDIGMISVTDTQPLYFGNKICLACIYHFDILLE